jgi:magnesium transporter
MAETSDWKELSERLKVIFEKPEKEPLFGKLYEALRDEPPANIALMMEDLSPEEAVTVFSALDKPVATAVLSVLAPDLAHQLLKQLNPDQVAGLIEGLPPREAAAIIAEAPSKQVKSFLNDEQANISAVHDLQYRLNYRKGSAGRLMTTQFVKLYKDSIVADALEVVRHTDKDVDIPEDLYIVERDLSSRPIRSKLLGAVSIRDLLMADPNSKVEEIMATDVITVAATTNEEDAAALVSKYKFMTLPVMDNDGYLVGVIPSDDLMQVVVGRLRTLYNKAVGTDAAAMENLSPFQAAKLRVPWLLGTMAIELGAGMVISHFDGILQKVILLASFLPIISAVSGNVGLQAAAITVRAVDAGTTKNKSVWSSIRKEIVTSLLMALVCGIVLGTIGGIWAKHLPFGLVIGGALTCSMVTAGLMGTVIPVVSQRLGFDPATTAGPFETAFQDVVGFGVFLWLATLLQNWIS